MVRRPKRVPLRSHHLCPAIFALHRRLVDHATRNDRPDPPASRRQSGRLAFAVAVEAEHRLVSAQTFCSIRPQRTGCFLRFCAKTCLPANDPVAALARVVAPGPTRGPAAFVPRGSTPAGAPPWTNPSPRHCEPPQAARQSMTEACRPAPTQSLSCRDVTPWIASSLRSSQRRSGTADQARGDAGNSGSIC
jgi:hypothetical protein